MKVKAKQALAKRSRHDPRKAANQERSYSHGTRPPMYVKRQPRTMLKRQRLRRALANGGCSMKIPTGAGTGKKSCLQTEEEMGKVNFPHAVGSGVLTMVKKLAKGIRKSSQQ